MSEKHSVDRRDFLKTAAVTGAAALGASHAATANEPAQAAPPAPAGAPAQASAPVAPREVDPAGERRGPDHRSPRRRLHGRRASSRSTSSTSPPTPARASAAFTSRSSTTAATRRPSSSPAARRIVGGDGARLLQGRRQADGGAVPRHGRHAARGDGDLQRLLRPRAGVHPRRQLARCDAAAARRGVGAQRAGRGGDGARLHQVGRSAGLAAALRRVGRARLQDRDDAADDAGAASSSTAVCRRIRSRTRSARACACRSSRVATPPQGDSGAVAEAARLLVNAQNPVIVADRAARTPAGIDASRSSSPRRCRRRSSIRAGA